MYTTGFFLTSAAEKTKTQAQNSSQKLKEKTQPQGGTFLLLRETKKTPQFYPKNLKTETFSWGTSFYAIFVNINVRKSGNPIRKFQF